MTSRPGTRFCNVPALCAGTLALIILFPAGALAQLRMSVWQAESGQVYQVLQHRAGEDFGVGIDEVRITSLSANSFAANVCASPPATGVGQPTLEALASGPIGGARPLDMAFKSPLIADASPPCFASSAFDGLGAVCIGPECAPSCACAEDADCRVFTMTDGLPLSSATPETPGAVVVAPLQVSRQHCDVVNGLAFGFGSTGHLTSETEVCAPAPADGIRLVNSPSAFSNGQAGTTIIFAYAAASDETIAVSAAGFGIDNDGQNPFDCDAPGRVVAAVQASGDEAPSETPPLPPVDLNATERRCQQAIGRAARRFSNRVLRSLQQCRDQILDGSAQIRPGQCFQQAKVAKTLSVAARVSRSSIRARCGEIDMSRLLTCGDRLDDLIAPDGNGGCLFDTHRNLAEQMAILEYGF